MSLLVFENNFGVLTEGKRDEMLLPYYEMVKDRIPSRINQGGLLKFGEFKGILLDKLASQGSMHKLSLGSNFYLAGAARYYFNGDLTIDGKVGLLADDPSTPDNWNTEVCKRLDALINVLRNAYLDTIGTAFEQPEDFGTLSLPKLLKKYGKKIDAELSGGEYEEEEVVEPEDEDDGLNRDNHVGNGYTFDILYTFEMAEKYCQATAPGSWCITYGKNNFDYYAYRKFPQYGGIHYVVFLKDGYERVARKTGPNFTMGKPQDEYGNSMIAYLQRNDSWEPTFITSRWNHGHDETHGCEADHAYNLEEFCNITGVSEEELIRIYEIWKRDKKKYPDEVEQKPKELDRSDVKKAFIDVKRALSYAQILMNYGENMLTALTNAGVNLANSRALYGSEEPEKFAKGIVKHLIAKDNITFSFITDKNKIIFESIITTAAGNTEATIKSFESEGIRGGAPGVFIVKGKNKCMIYNGKYHEFLTIDGQSMFCKTPGNCYSPNRGVDKATAFEIKQSRSDIAIILASDIRPVKFPNGGYFANKIVGCGIRTYARREIECTILGENFGSAIKIIVDESSGESYFFNMKTKKFFSPPVPLIDPENPHNMNRVLTINTDFSSVNGYYSLSYGTYSKKVMLFNERDQQVAIYGRTEFRDIAGDFGRFIYIDDGRVGLYGGVKAYRVYDTVTKRYIGVGDRSILVCGRYSSEHSDDGKFAFFRCNDDDYYYINNSSNYVYNTEKGLCAINPLRYPDENSAQSPIFKVASAYKAQVWNSNYDYYEARRAIPDGLDWQAQREFENKYKEKKVNNLNDLDLQYYPNNVPVNDETNLQQPADVQANNEPAVATAVREERINNIVRETLKKLYERKL